MIIKSYIYLFNGFNIENGHYDVLYCILRLRITSCNNWIRFSCIQRMIKFNIFDGIK